MSPLSSSAMNVATDSHLTAARSADFDVVHGRSLSDEMGDLVPGIDFAARPHSEHSQNHRDSAERTLTSFEKLGTMRNLE